jgi:hypothetical protein
MSLFRKGDDMGTEARLGLIAYDDRLVADGFFLAAQLLTEAMPRDDVHPHLLVYPLVFNLRHFTELKLKHVIKILMSLARFKDDATMQAALTDHRLDNLLSLLRAGAETQSDVAQVSSQLDMVTDHIQEFHNLDPGSYSFRYTSNKSGSRYVKPGTTFDLQILFDGMLRVRGALNEIEEWGNDIKVRLLNEWAIAVEAHLAAIWVETRPEGLKIRPRLVSGNLLQMQWGLGSKWVTCQLFPDREIHMWFWDDSTSDSFYEILVPSSIDADAVQSAAGMCQ